MASKPPRFLPTLALAVLWVALYVVWIAVRPTTEATTATQTRGRTATTTTTVPALFKFKP
ncbi:MAG TPA: hypothetical protein VEG38_09335 [Acidimicrobiia bacterium]|nr:hypothetical protein [Acidimicrobiia bacterium]